MGVVSETLAFIDAFMMGVGGSSTFFELIHSVTI